MKLNKIKKIRHDIAKDLMDFKSCLTGILEDSSPIESAISELRRDSVDPIWSYSIDDLILIIDNSNFRHIRPKDIPTGKNIRVSLSTTIEGNCEIWEESYENCSFNNLSLKLKIAHESELYQTAFHLDICKPDESKSGESHPTFHLQFKPNVDNDDSFEYGQVLELDTPRFAHPPMEIILGLDFAFSNFAPDLWVQLHEDGTYLNLLRKYQASIWQPYYTRISSFWQGQFNEKKDNWHPQALLPNLINRND
jgi:hypothetical protein